MPMREENENMGSGGRGLAETQEKQGVNNEKGDRSVYLVFLVIST